MGGIVASLITHIGWYYSQSFSVTTLLRVVGVVSAVGEVVADMLPHGHPPHVTEVQHVLSLLLPPLSPPARSSVFYGNIIKPVTDFPVVCSDTKGVQVW